MSGGLLEIYCNKLWWWWEGNVNTLMIQLSVWTCKFKEIFRGKFPFLVTNKCYWTTPYLLTNSLSSLSLHLYGSTYFNIPPILTQTVTAMSLVSQVSHIMHLHSPHCCWSGTVFACVDLKETGAGAAEWSQGGS